MCQKVHILKQEVAYLCFLFPLSASCTNTLYTFLFFRPLLKHFIFIKNTIFETGSCIFMLSIF